MVSGKEIIVKKHITYICSDGKFNGSESFTKPLTHTIYISSYILPLLHTLIHLKHHTDPFVYF